MQKLTKFPTAKLEQTDGVYVTIAQRLEASSVDFNKESTKLRSNLNDVTKQIEEKCDDDTKARLLEGVEEVRKNSVELVSHKGAVAIYITKDEVYYYHLSVLTDEVAAVSVLPHLKPLVENFQYANEYDLLVLNREDFRFFSGNAVSIEEVKIEDQDSPITLEAALGTEKTGGNLSHSTASNQGGYHGHKETSNEKDIDRVNYFRAVDKYIYDNYSLESERPLVLYALADNQSVFRDISKNNHLVERGIEESGSGENIQHIEKKVVALNRELVNEEQSELIDLFDETSPQYKVENDWAELASVAFQGKVSELVIRNDFDQEGSIDENGNYVEEGNLFLTQLVAKVLQNKGTVYVIDEDYLPESVNVSARLRY